MSQETATSILGIELTTRQLILLLVIGILGLHPFVLARVSPSPFVLGLPWWYFADVGFLAAIYVVIQLYVESTQTGTDRFDDGGDS